MSAEDLRQAIVQGYLQVFYQPKVACGDHRLLGIEALARVVHPQKGVLYPDSFYPDRGGQSTDWRSHPSGGGAGTEFSCAQFFCGQAKSWRSRRSGRTKDSLRVSINLSPQVLRQKDFVEELMSACSSNGIDPEHIILELTETTAMENPAESLAMLTRLRVKGFAFVSMLRDRLFSMQQLVKLPFSEIKIDKSFVMTSRSSEESRTVIESIIRLASSLKLSSVAEGVEDMEALEYLRAAGCDVAQGYLLSRPIQSGT